MFARLRSRRPSHTTVAAYLALFVAVSTGGAYAANTVGSVDVIDESLLSQDFKNGEVKTSELADAAVTRNKLASGVVTNGKLGGSAVDASKVADNSLGGADILESSLAQVPNSEKLDGIDSKDFARLGGVINGDGTVVQGSGFSVSRPNDGEYQVSFPAGTLSSGHCPPVAVMVPFSGLVRHPQISGRSCSGLGAGSFTAKMLDSDGVAHDTSFLFIAM